MGRFIKGDVVVLPFPFTDLSHSKRRHALILSGIQGDDYVMLQITSQNVRNSYAIPLLETDFQEGTLRKASNIRPNKIFTLDRSLILYKIGHVSGDKINESVQKVCDIVSRNT